MGILLPTKEQFKALMKMDMEEPIVMINLLKFKPDGGAESYQVYKDKFTELMADKGVELIYSGDSQMTVIGHEEWDEVILARYPSLKAFIEMNRDPEYLKIANYRHDGLEDSRLIMTRQSS